MDQWCLLKRMLKAEDFIFFIRKKIPAKPDHIATSASDKEWLTRNVRLSKYLST